MDAQSGEVLGIATLIYEGGQNLNFANPAQQIAALIASASSSATVRRAELVRKTGKELLQWKKLVRRWMKLNQVIRLPPGPGTGPPQAQETRDDAGRSLGQSLLGSGRNLDRSRSSAYQHAMQPRRRPPYPALKSKTRWPGFENRSMIALASVGRKFETRVVLLNVRNIERRFVALTEKRSGQIVNAWRNTRRKDRSLSKRCSGA